MKKRLVIIGLALAILFGIGYKSQAQAYTSVSFNLFFDALAPYGNWISTPDYGYVWQPTDMGQDWRPYTDGQWVWTDDGWTWVSYQPWGWAPYHYGRWIFTNDYGWVWIPGTTWAPAWVTWYTGPDYIGWAPLPPDNSSFLQIGIGPIGFSYYTQPSYCVFVPASSFLSVNIDSVVAPSWQNVTIIRNTTNINNITVVNNRVINTGPGVSFVERATGAGVQKVNVIDRNIDPAVVKSGSNINRLEGRNLYVFRPDVVKKGNEKPILKAEAVKGGENRIPQVYRQEVNTPNFNQLNRSNQSFPRGEEFSNPNTNREVINTPYFGQSNGSNRSFTMKKEFSNPPANKEVINTPYFSQPNRSNQSFSMGRGFNNPHANREVINTPYFNQSNGGNQSFSKGKEFSNPHVNRQEVSTPSSKKQGI